ncbi:HD domain-containing phosphohydrolase [Bacillus sp. REN10]|uniref:HD-GYP domain-containing protein n=1 Tax=Bacillus sp. REN10 TaxID=2782541 RepID=UPI00193B43D6|nr:HD domain-containing phosphohydrolase [Bacillus sp. REN10]
MYIKVEDLQAGYVLQDDVMGKTSCPLIAKNTILTDRHIELLKAFLIKEVDVQIDGSTLPEVTDEKSSLKVTLDFSQEEFSKQYMEGEQQYNKEFLKWQAGMSIDIVKIRGIILPLLEQVRLNSDLFLHLHKWTSGHYRFHHPLAVGLMSGSIAEKLNFENGMIIQAALAGVLADCGLAKVPTSILKVSTNENEKELRKHPLHSYNMVKELKLLKQEAKIAIFQHHERLDGTGYSMGDKGEKIHPLSRIVAVADTFYELTAPKEDQSHVPPFKALEIIKEDYFGKFDIKAVKALISIFMKMGPGTAVRLSNGQRGNIFFMKQQYPTRPLVQLSGDNSIVDLEKMRELYIEEIL